MAMAQPRLEDQVLVFADNLLSESAGLTCGEWIERKRIARAVQALVTDQVTPWTEDQLDLIEYFHQHRPEHIWTHSCEVRTQH